MDKYRNAQRTRCESSRKLDEIAAHRAQERKVANKASYCMHIPKEAMRKLEERSRARY